MLSNLLFSVVHLAIHTPIHPFTHPMALQPIAQPRPSITSVAEVLFSAHSVLGATLEKSSTIFFYTSLPIKAGSPHWSIARELRFQEFFGIGLNFQRLRNYKFHMK